MFRSCRRLDDNGAGGVRAVYGAVINWQPVDTPISLEWPVHQREREIGWYRNGLCGFCFDMQCLIVIMSLLVTAAPLALVGLDSHDVVDVMVPDAVVLLQGL